MNLTASLTGQDRGNGSPPELSSVIHFVASNAEKSLCMKKIMLHTSDRVEVVDLDDVVFVSAVRGYSVIFTASGKKILSAKTLSEYEALLAPLPHFIRANKSYLINLNHVKGYTKGTVCAIFMRGSDTEIEVSRRKKKWITGLLRREYAEAQA